MRLSKKNGLVHLVAIVVSVLTAAVVSYGQTTQATTATTATTSHADQLAVALVDHERALQDWDRARARSIAEFETSADYIPVHKELLAKDAAYQAARKSGTPRQRLDASQEFVKVNERLKRMRADAIAKDEGVISAQEMVKSASERLIRATDENAIAQRRAAAERAKRIYEKKVEHGMTVQQVEELWGKPESSVDEGDGTNLIVWRDYVWVEKPANVRGGGYAREVAPGSNLGPGGGGTRPQVRHIARTLVAEFRQGVLVHFTDEKTPPPVSD